MFTSNVTGCHQDLKRKLQAGYSAPSLKCMSYCNYFSLSSVASCAFSVLCVYLKFGHHPHPLGYLCAKFCFFCGLHCSATHGEKSRTQSLTQLAYSITHSPSLFDAPGTEAYFSELQRCWFWVYTKCNTCITTHLQLTKILNVTSVIFPLQVCAFISHMLYFTCAPAMLRKQVLLLATSVHVSVHAYVYSRKI